MPDESRVLVGPCSASVVFKCVTAEINFKNPTKELKDKWIVPAGESNLELVESPVCAAFGESGRGYVHLQVTHGRCVFDGDSLSVEDRESGE